MFWYVHDLRGKEASSEVYVGRNAEFEVVIDNLVGCSVHGVMQRVVHSEMWKRNELKEEVTELTRVKEVVKKGCRRRSGRVKEMKEGLFRICCDNRQLRRVQA